MLNKAGMMFVHVNAQCWPGSNSLEYSAPHRWSDILKSIFLKVKLSPPCLFHSNVLWDWQLALQVLAGGFERKFALASSFLPSLHLRQARWPGVWERCGNGGTRLRSAVEMAVSIKYHFQFPCFMIPGLLSTNNPPSAGPPTLSWGRLITLVASYKKDIYMKIKNNFFVCMEVNQGKKQFPIWFSYKGEAR